MAVQMTTQMAVQMTTQMAAQMTTQTAVQMTTQMAALMTTLIAVQMTTQMAAQMMIPMDHLNLIELHNWLRPDCSRRSSSNLVGSKLTKKWKVCGGLSLI